MNSIPLKWLLACGGLSALVAVTALAADPPKKNESEAPVQVGTYDSRAVAVAFAASEAFSQELQQWREKKRQAEAAGDEQAVERIEAKAVLRQRRLHHQGFGTAPVDDILGHIKDELPGIARRAGVDVIVSKWAIDYQTPQVEFVDVTELMVEPFKPDERRKEIIRQLRDKPPVSWEQIERHGHDH